MAHRDTHFRGLKNLANGDALTLETREGRLERHLVARTEVVKPDEVAHALAVAESGALVLMTCWPFEYLGSAPKRILFHCREAMDTAR